MLYELFHYNLGHCIQLTLDAVGSHGGDASDIEAFVAGKFSEGVFLSGRETAAVADHRHSITHIVVEHGLKVYHLKGNIEDAVIDGSSYAVGSQQVAFQQCSAGESTGIALLILDDDEGCGVGQLAHTEHKLSHLLWTTGVGGGDGDGHILSYLRRTGDISTGAYGLECSAWHRGLHLVEGYTGHTHTDGVVIPCIEHVHQVGGHRSTGIDNGVFLREVSAYALSTAVVGLYISSKVVFTWFSTNYLIDVVTQVHLPIADEDIRGLRRVNGSHHDARRELVASHVSLLFGDDKGIEGIDTDILHVDVSHEGVEHLALGIPHVAL